jgi:rod shape-determining protein MreD
MRWATFLILVYLILALHLALGGFVNWGRAQPNLVLPMVVFIALNAPREHALAGAFVLGLGQDALSFQAPGLFAFTYSIVTMFLLGARPGLYRDHPLTHMAMTLLAGLLTAGLVLFHAWAVGRLHQTDPGALAWGPALFGAGYTALLAPLLLLPLVKLKRLFGFQAARVRGRYAPPVR